MLLQHHSEISTVYEQLQKSVQEIESQAALLERNRIARDIHDSLGSALTSLNIHLQTALLTWHIDPVQAKQLVADAQRLGKIAVKELRQSVSILRQPDTFPKQQLEVLIDSLVQDFYRTSGVLPYTLINLSVPLSSEVEIALYRITQESLTNICKYARATEVRIYLCNYSNMLYFSIQDNGKGFDVSDKKTSFGLQGIRERVAELKGDINLESEPGNGFKIQIQIPLEISSKNCMEKTVGVWECRQVFSS